MAKMFYTLNEVCRKLGKSEDEVRAMATSGQIQEFRDRDKLMFKVEQIDLLAGGDEDSGEVHLELEDTSGGSGLGLSGTGLGQEPGGSQLGLTGSAVSDARSDSGGDSREGTGISVFDTDHGEEDTGEGTRVGEGVEEEIGLEAVGSGSGLLDLTRESDDTSLGAELLEEVYSGEENVEIPTNASGLFEAAAPEGGEEAVAAAGIAAMPMLVEAYDGGGSGLGIGLMLGAMASLIVVGLVIAVSVIGGTSPLAMTIAGSIWLWAGGLLGGTLLLGLVGWFIGKSSE
jgi:hypothetical protein